MEVEDPTATLILREKSCSEILGVRGYPMSLAFLPQPHINEHEKFSNFGIITILVLDRSGSMDGDREAKSITASRSLLSSLADGAKFAIIVFENQGRVIVPVSEKSPQVVESSLTTLEANRSNGGTNFFEAFQTAYSLVPQNSREKYHIIFLTDGEDSGSIPASVTLIEQKVIETDTRVSCLGVTSGDTSNMDATLRQLALAGNGKYITMTDQCDNLDFENVFGMVAQQAMNHCTTNYSITFDDKFILAVSGLLNPKISIPAGQQLRFNLLISEALVSTTEFVVEYDDSRFPQGRNRFKKTFLIMLKGDEYVVLDQEFQSITRELHQDILVKATPMYCPQVGLLNRITDPVDAQKCVLAADNIRKLQENHHSSIIKAGLQIEGLSAVVLDCDAAKGSGNGNILAVTKSVNLTSVEAVIDQKPKKKQREKKPKPSEDAKLESFQNHPHRQLLQTLTKKVEAGGGRFSTNQISELNPHLPSDSIEKLKRSLLLTTSFKKVDPDTMHDVLCANLARNFLVNSNMPSTRAAWELADKWINGQSAADFSSVAKWLEHILSKLEKQNWSQDPALLESAIKEATAIYIPDPQPVSVPIIQASNPFEMDTTEPAEFQQTPPQSPRRLSFSNISPQPKVEGVAGVQPAFVDLLDISAAVPQSGDTTAPDSSPDWLVPSKANTLVHTVEQSQWFVYAVQAATTVPLLGPKLAELSPDTRSRLILIVLALALTSSLALLCYPVLLYCAPVLCTAPVWTCAVVYFPTIRTRHDQLQPQLIRIFWGSVLAYLACRFLPGAGIFSFASNLAPASFLLLAFEVGYSLHVMLKFTASKTVALERPWRLILAAILLIFMVKDAFGEKELAGVQPEVLSQKMVTLQLLLVGFGWICCFPEQANPHNQFLSLSNNEGVTTSLTGGTALAMRQHKESLKDMI